jgi:Tol biopolymer transport system component
MAIRIHLSRATLLALAASFLALSTANLAAAAELISVHAFTGEAAGHSALRGVDTISDNGRYVVFQSSRYSLVRGDTNRLADIFVRDRWLQTTRRVSVASDGTQSDGWSDAPAISGDGRYVVFQSNATNLVKPVLPNRYFTHVYLHDTVTGRTELMSRASSGGIADQGSFEPTVSRDGRYVAFLSEASNLVEGYVGTRRSVYMRDRSRGVTELISDGYAYSVSISADGRHVAFDTDARIPGDVNGSPDVLVRDRSTGTLELISATPAGNVGMYGGRTPIISANGRHVTFASSSPNLVPDDSNGTTDVFVRDRQLRSTFRVSVDSAGGQLAGGAEGGQFGSAISADGRFVVFVSSDPFVVPGDINGTYDIFVRDTALKRTLHASISADGKQGYSIEPVTAAISASGRFVAFDSYSSGFVPNDSNYAQDVFVHDFGDHPATAPEFTLKPLAVSFGDRAVGSATVRSLWLQNDGAADLPLTSVRLRGEHASMFSVRQRCGSVVPAGTGCAIRVTYSPTVTGAHSAKLVVVVAEDVRRVRALTGSGVPAQ